MIGVSARHTSRQRRMIWKWALNPPLLSAAVVALKLRYDVCCCSLFQVNHRLLRSIILQTIALKMNVLLKRPQLSTTQRLFQDYFGILKSWHIQFRFWGRLLLRIKRIELIKCNLGIFMLMSVKSITDILQSIIFRPIGHALLLKLRWQNLKIVD